MSLFERSLVIALVSNTPCARARGFVEIRPFWDLAGEGA